jgi:transcriptional regulator of aromatic amino acid metabolism
MSHSIAESLVAHHVRNLRFEINITAFTLGVDGGSVLLRNVGEVSPQYSAICLRLPDC